MALHRNRATRTIPVGAPLFDTLADMGGTCNQYSMDMPRLAGRALSAHHEPHDEHAGCPCHIAPSGPPASSVGHWVLTIEDSAVPEASSLPGNNDQGSCRLFLL